MRECSLLPWLDRHRHGLICDVRNPYGTADILRIEKSLKAAAGELAEEGLWPFRSLVKKNASPKEQRCPPDGQDQGPTFFGVEDCAG